MPRSSSPEKNPVQQIEGNLKHDKWNPSTILGAEADKISMRIEALRRELMHVVVPGEDVNLVEDKTRRAKEEITLLSQQKQELLEIAQGVIKGDTSAIQKAERYFNEKSAESARNLRTIHARNEQGKIEQSPDFQEYSKWQELLENARALAGATGSSESRTAVKSLEKAVASTKYGGMLAEADKERRDLESYQSIAFEIKQRGDS